MTQSEPLTLGGPVQMSVSTGPGEMVLTRSPLLGVLLGQRLAEVGQSWSERNAVPAPLAATFDFLNTLDERTFGAHRPVDAIAAPEELAAWLRRHGLVPEGTECSAAQHREALRLRAALRAAAAGVGDGRVDLPLRAEVGSDGVLALRGAGDGVPGALLAAAVTGSADGSWQRVKMCAAADCKVLFYDHTKPRNGRWCSATGCGNRSKTRSYRSRKA